MNITGKIIELNATNVVSDRFSKREFVVEETKVIGDGREIKNPIPMQFTNDKCRVLDSYKVGDNVTVDFNIKGRNYNGKYYLTVEAWKISKNAPIPQSQPYAQSQYDNEVPF